MKEFKFKTQYDPPEIQKEKNSGKNKVETAGYIPPDVQITRFMMAGKRLGEYRKEAYDFDTEKEIEEGYFDPTRSPNFDMADATALDRAVKARLEEQANKPKEEPVKEDPVKEAE